MKRNIWDLMDGFPVDDVEIENSSPLSSQRIKELTMGKVKKAPKRRIGFRLLVVAAVIAALSTTVFAAETIMTYDNWLKDFLSDKEVIADISENQLDILDQSVAELNQSVTSGDYTVTLEKAITDGYLAYMTFRVEAPEGVILDGEYYNFEEVPRNLFGESVDDGAVTVSSAGWEMLDDGNSTDNSILLVLKVQTSGVDSHTKPIDGEMRTISLKHLVEFDVENHTQEVIAEGDWTFSFSFGDSSVLTAEIEMLPESVQCTGKRLLGQKFFDVTVKVSSFRLRALTATLVFDKPLTGYWDGIHLDSIYVVMKDGTQIKAHYSSGGTEAYGFECIYEFDVPVSFAEVDYVAFPGGDKAYIGAGEWFRESADQNQIAVISELGDVFAEQSHTSEGTTIFLPAAYGDDHVMYLYLQVIAPEGTVLPDDIDYIFYDPNSIDYEDENHWRHLQVAEGAPYKLVYGPSFDIQPLTDADPTDNKKDFYITITAQDKQKAKFNDGITKYFNIAGIYQQVANVNMDEDGYYLIAPGNFSFNVGMVNEVEKVELDVKGLTYGGHKTRTWTHDSECHPLCDEMLTGETDPETELPIHAEEWDYSVTVKKLVISSLSAEWEVEYSSSNPAQQMGIEFYVVMKDGTSPLAFPTARSWSEDKTMGVVRFETPIDFEEIDYILIGDPEIDSTHKIYLPN